MRDPSRRLAALAAVFAMALAVGGCGSAENANNETRTRTLSVYVSVPLAGQDAAAGRAVVNGAKLALAQASGTVGDLEVRALYLDDTGGGARWSPVVTADNARRAAEDTSAIAYIGELSSGATRFSLPITNQAETLHVSPAATAVDLTRQVAGGEDPARLRPSGKQTFARIVPADDVQARAAARFANQVGVARIPPLQYADPGRLEDGTRYTSPVFGWSAGGPEPQPSAPPGAEREARRFGDEYLKRYGRVAPPYAAQGYEAMAAVLDAIRRAGDGGDNRADVIGAFLDTHDRRSPIGTYSIEPDGDTTLKDVAGLKIEHGRPFFEKSLTG